MVEGTSTWIESMSESEIPGFGVFFGEVRNQRQVGLREFCAEHGFDPGNISRLEAGKRTPPKSSKVLDRYARALGLEPGSGEWRRFFDLAAAERGELPADLRENGDVLRELPGVFDRLRAQVGTLTSSAK